MSKMSALKEITIVGNLVRDPELRFTPSGAAVANFTVAVNDRKFDKQTGEWQEMEPAFISCSAWRGLAENIAESFTSGQRLIVKGKFGPRTYDDKDTGKKVTVWEMEAEEVGGSVSYATAKMTKVNRASGGNGGSNTPAADDPWASNNTATPAFAANDPF